MAHHQAAFDEIAAMPIRVATSDEFGRILKRLEEAGHLWGVADPVRTIFLVNEGGGRLAGWVGLEIGEHAALMRSLFVEPDARGNGLGGRLVEAVEAEALLRGKTRMCLFSTDAGAYYLRRGYEEAPVAEVVAGAAGTPQVEWVVTRPEVLAAEVTSAKELV